MSKKTVLLSIVLLGFLTPLLYLTSAKAISIDRSYQVILDGDQDIWPASNTRFSITSYVAVDTYYNDVIGGYVISAYDVYSDVNAAGWWLWYRIYHWEDVSESTTLTKVGRYLIKVTRTIYGRVEASSSNYMEITLSVWVDCEKNYNYQITIHDYHLSNDMNLNIDTYVSYDKVLI